MQSSPKTILIQNIQKKPLVKVQILNLTKALLVFFYAIDIIQFQIIRFFNSILTYHIEYSWLYLHILL